MDSMKLWAEVYGPRFHTMQAREEALREQAFVDWTSDVLGEPLRQMTLGDMFRLQGAGSPYIAGGAYPEPVDALQFLWELHAENRGSVMRRWWHRRRMVRRVALRVVEGDPMEAWNTAINRYLDDVFLDAPKKKKDDTRPVGVCFMASLLVRLSNYIGTVDPASGRGWSEIPIARIFQYLKAINRNELGNDFKDFSPSDRVMSEWLAHGNRLAAQDAPPPSS
jgi:hypothetical protein